MKLFTEGNLTTSTIDQPGQFRTKHTGESRLGKTEVHHNFESASLKYKTKEVSSTCYCRCDVITQKSENKSNRINKR